MKINLENALNFTENQNQKKVIKADHLIIISLLQMCIDASAMVAIR